MKTTNKLLLLSLISLLFFIIIIKTMRRDSYVGITTELRAARPRNGGSIPGRGTFFSSPKRPDRLLAGHPASYIKGSVMSFPTGKGAGA
jgi:hypothetical protein